MSCVKAHSSTVMSQLKGERIEVMEPSIPLPEQGPKASDKQSANGGNIGVKSGLLSGNIGGNNPSAEAGLRDPTARLSDSDKTALGGRRRMA
jgi:hypothetical protein